MLNVLIYLSILHKTYINTRESRDIPSPCRPLRYRYIRFLTSGNKLHYIYDVSSTQALYGDEKMSFITLFGQRDNAPAIEPRTSGQC